MTATLENPTLPNDSPEVTTGTEAYEQTLASLDRLVDLELLERAPGAGLQPADVMRNPYFYDAVTVTDLSYCSHPDDDVQVYEKMELSQPTGSFKVRGAFVACFEALRQNPDLRNFAAYSAGNHGMGVAHFVQWFNRQLATRGDVRLDPATGQPLPEDTPKLAQAHIFCKGTASPAKVAMLQGSGAIVHDGTDQTEAGFDSLEAAARAAENFTAASRQSDEMAPAVLIPPYDHPDVRAGGGGTVVVEAVMQLWNRGVDTLDRPLVFYEAAGGGGLTLGSAVTLDVLVQLGLVHPGSQVVAAQMENSDSLRRGEQYYQAGVVKLGGLFIDQDGTDHFNPAADGVAVRDPSLAHVALAHNLKQAGRLRFATVNMAEAGQEKLRAKQAGVTKEPAGALAGAAQRKDTINVLNSEVIQVIVSSGRNEALETAEQFYAAAGGLAVRSNQVSAGATWDFRSGLVIPRSQA